MPPTLGISGGIAPSWNPGGSTPSSPPSSQPRSTPKSKKSSKPKQESELERIKREALEAQKMLDTIKAQRAQQNLQQPAQPQVQPQIQPQVQPQVQPQGQITDAPQIERYVPPSVPAGTPPLPPYNPADPMQQAQQQAPQAPGVAPQAPGVAPQVPGVAPQMPMMPGANPVTTYADQAYSSQDGMQTSKMFSKDAILAQQLIQYVSGVPELAEYTKKLIKSNPLSTAIVDAVTGDITIGDGKEFEKTVKKEESDWIKEVSNAPTSIYDNKEITKSYEKISELYEELSALKEAGLNVRKFIKSKKPGELSFKILEAITTSKQSEVNSEIRMKQNEIDLATRVLNVQIEMQNRVDRLYRQDRAFYADQKNKLRDDILAAYRLQTQIPSEDEQELEEKKLEYDSNRLDYLQDKLDHDKTQIGESGSKKVDDFSRRASLTSLIEKDKEGETKLTKTGLTVAAKLKTLGNDAILKIAKELGVEVEEAGGTEGFWRVSEDNWLLRPLPKFEARTADDVLGDAINGIILKIGGNEDLIRQIMAL